MSNFAPEDKIKYHNDMTTDRDIRNQIAFARDKGVEEGIAQGITQGVIQGVTQRNIEIARAMLKEGLDIVMVSRCTGLTADEIKALSSHPDDK